MTHSAAAAANQLALELYGACAKDSGHVIFSTRAIAYTGAVMYVGISAENRATLASENVRELLLQPLSAKSECNTSVTAMLYDSTRMGGTILPDVVDKMKSEGLNFIPVDYRTGCVTENQCDEINKIAEKCTDGAIDNVVTFAQLSRAQVPKILIRTVTKFKDEWITPFTRATTRPFYVAENEFISIPTMSINQVKNVNISSLESQFNATIFQLPYKSGASMIIHMPDRVVSGDELYNLVPKVYARDNNFEKMLGSFALTDVGHISVPKFSHSSTFDITESVVKVKLMEKLLLNPQLMFTNAHFEYVTHEITCSVDVDEVGTVCEAVAMLCCTDGVAVSRSLAVIRPFIYFILDEFSNIVDIGTFTRYQQQ